MVKKRCIVCAKEILVKPSHVQRGWGRYCSKRCQYKAQRKGRWLECDYCGERIYRTPKDFSRSKSGKFFCSVACHCSWENENRRCGENAPNWVSGHQVYRRLMIRYGASKVCKRCSIQDERVLVVHHRDRNRRNNKKENLEWLCWNCHYLEHLVK